MYLSKATNTAYPSIISFVKNRLLPNRMIFTCSFEKPKSTFRYVGNVIGNTNTSVTINVIYSFAQIKKKSLTHMMLVMVFLRYFICWALAPE